MRVHGVPIKIERGMTDAELTRAIIYSAHSSATKGTTFVRKELQEQALAGHIVIFPLRPACYLPKLWLSPLAVAPPTSSPLMWLSGLLQHYRYQLDVNGRFTYYLNHLAPLFAALRRSRVAQCHLGVVGGVPKPSYSLLS